MVKTKLLTRLTDIKTIPNPYQKGSDLVTFIFSNGSITLARKKEDSIQYYYNRLEPYFSFQTKKDINNLDYLLPVGHEDESPTPLYNLNYTIVGGIREHAKKIRKLVEMPLSTFSGKKPLRTTMKYMTSGNDMLYKKLIKVHVNPNLVWPETKILTFQFSNGSVSLLRDQKEFIDPSRIFTRTRFLDAKVPEYEDNYKILNLLKPREGTMKFFTTRQVTFPVNKQNVLNSLKNISFLETYNSVSADSEILRIHDKW